MSNYIDKIQTENGNLYDIRGSIYNNETVLSTDKEPYVMRKAKNIANATPYIRETLVGGTIGWNQMIQNGNFESATGWSGRYATVSVSSNVATLTPSSAGTLRGLTAAVGYGINIIVSHKYLLYCYVKPPINVTASCDFETVSRSVSLTANTWNFVPNIVNATTSTNIRFYCLVNESLTTSQAVLYKNANIVDLTIMLGTTIADYIYGLETITAGSGIAKLREWGFFTKAYYPYNTGSVLSVQTRGHKVTGFNQWDEQWKNGYYTDSGSFVSDASSICSSTYCSCLEGETYYFNRTTGTNKIHFYDANKTFLSTQYNLSPYTFTVPSGARYFMITCYAYGATYNNDICVNVSDSTRNGTYEPYRTNTYNVDNIIMRGIPKLDANNLLYYDGDTYESDGHATIKYGYVDMGSLDWNLAGSGATSRFEAQLPMANMPNSQVVAANIICAKYPTYSWNNALVTGNKGICGLYLSANDIRIAVKDDSYTSTTFPSAISGVELTYELITPYEETWHSFDNPQYVYPGGTEEYIDTRETPVPVGHITEYMGANDEKFYAPSNPIDDEKYVLTNKSGSVFWSRESKWISLKNGSYDEGSMSQKLTLPSNWTNVKIALEYHALHLGSTSEIIQTEVTRDIYEEGHYMSGGICTVSFGLYGTLSCRIILGEYTNSSNETVYYIEMDDVKGDEGVTVISDFHFWVYYTI